MSKAFAALATILLLPCLARAWGGDGHQIICLIAEDQLTPEARAAVHELLGAGVNISDAEVANWADEVRRERTETGPWHYVNIPTTQPAYDAARDGRGGENVIDRITGFERVLADRNASRDDRAEALKFLVHFVGDIHQPLHCADRNGDRGGNARLVFFLDEPMATNLHHCWDTSILLHRKGSTRVVDYARALDAGIGAAQAAEWSKTVPQDWANESHRIAIESVYKDVPEGGDPPKLDEAYLARSGPIIDQQLKKAGVRLAMILNRTLR
jgi:nuclease S1